MHTRYFITGIHTDSGKTLVSAVFTQALEADYWKPIQAGLPRDTDTVRTLVQNKQSVFHQEAYLLQAPMSPHAAAKLEGIAIELKNSVPPVTDRPLIIEGAGGVLVPLNDTDFVIDIAAVCEAEVILVANIYLGSINHTLLTIRELKRRDLKVKGLVFNGPSNPESERIILHHSDYPLLLRVHQEPAITPALVSHYAAILQENLKKYD
jgi:dethiobiotin synthetase